MVRTVYSCFWSEYLSKPEPADHPSPVGLTDSEGERGVGPEPADHPSPVGLTDSEGERGVGPEPADVGPEI